MSINEELTIVIPARNEERLIGSLLDSICSQNYERIRSTRIYVADATSTDGTVERALGYADRLQISIIPGGFPQREEMPEPGWPVAGTSSFSTPMWNWEITAWFDVRSRK